MKIFDYFIQRIDMRKFLLYFASALMGVLLGYLINQWPGLPEQLKPWVIPITGVVSIISAGLLTAQMEDSPKTGMRRIKIKGNRNKLRAGINQIEHAQIQGDENDLNTHDDQMTGGRRP
jgi:hypothetical protein